MERKSSVALALLAGLNHESQALVTGTINIVGGMMLQQLPGSYVNTFPRWTVERTVDDSISVSRMIGSGGEQSIEQFVDPTSNVDLWWPSDLKKLQVRPSLDILIRGAVPAYALAGLEVKVPADVSMDEQEWKNFGLNCQPLASQWSAFEIAAETGFRVETFYGISTDNGEEKEENNTAEIDWKYIASDSSDKSCTENEMETLKAKAEKGTQKAMDLLGTLLAGMDDQSPLVDGMHILSFPITNEWIDLPSVSDEKGYRLVSVGTVESNAKELLSMGEDMLTMSATSILNVGVSSIAPGSASEYIPAVYKKLYNKN